MNNELKRALRPVKARLRRNRLVRGAAAGLAAGLGTAALLQAVSFFVPVQDRGLQAAGIAAAAALLTALGNALRPVKDKDAAEAADACGLQERAITALEGGEEPIRQLQRRDACAALEKLDVKKIRPGSVRKALYAALGCAALLGCLLLVPSPQDSEADARKALNRTLQESRKMIDQAEKEDETSLTDEEKNELRKITRDLNRELKESRDAADALVALDRAEQRLEKLRDRKTAGDAMAASEGMTGLSEGQTGEAGKEGMTAGEVSGDTSAQDGSGQDGSASGGESPTASQMQTLQALAALKAMVNPSSLGGMAGAAGNQGKGAQGGNGNTGSGSSGNGDKSGGGAGEGSTNKEQNRHGGKGSYSGGTRDPKYKEGTYETIYDPERIDKPAQNVLTEQFRTSDEGGAQLETGPGRGNLNGDVPWNDVVQEYADTEAQAADRENLTVQERQWVNEYYRLLTEQQ